MWNGNIVRTSGQDKVRNDKRRLSRVERPVDLVECFLGLRDSSDKVICVFVLPKELDGPNLRHITRSTVDIEELAVGACAPAPDSELRHQAADDDLDGGGVGLWRGCSEYEVSFSEDVERKKGRKNGSKQASKPS